MVDVVELADPFGPMMGGGISGLLRRRPFRRESSKQAENLFDGLTTYLTSGGADAAGPVELRPLPPATPAGFGQGGRISGDLLFKS